MGADEAGRAVLLTGLSGAGMAHAGHAEPCRGWARRSAVMSMVVRYAGDSYRYLLDTVADTQGHATAMTDYYTAPGTPPGRWAGSGLAGLADGVGLPAGSVVTEEQLRRLFAEGTDPTTGQVLGRRYTGAPGRRPVAGFDLTFSAPQSVSLLWGLGGPAVRRVLYAAHHQALGEVLETFERDVARTRIGADGIAQVGARGVIAASFDHWDSRAGDPQLHTHVLVANRVQGPDGAWRTLDSRAIHRATVALSERYDAVLRDKVSAALGVAWEQHDRGPDRNPAWIIRGIPDPVLKEFSRRGTAIGQATDELITDYVAAHGRRPSPTTVLKLRQQATLATRPAKTVHSLAWLVDSWQQRATTVVGGDPRRWVAELLARQTPPPAHSATVVDAVVQQDVAVVAGRVLDRLTERRTIWSPWNIEAETHRAAAGNRFASTADRDRFTTAVVALVEANSVLLSAPALASTPDRLTRPDGTSVFRPERCQTYTSTAVLHAETRLLDAARSQDAPCLDPDLLAHADTGNQGIGLDDDQAAAMTAIAASGRRVDVLVGPAGTGKTTTLNALAAAWHKQFGPGSVVGLAPSATAAHVLADSLGITTENTAKWLYESAGEGAARRAQQLADLTDSRAQMTAAPATPATRRALVDLDEATTRIAAEQDRWRLHQGQLILVDEASLAATTALDRIAAQAAQAGAKVLLVGDWAQLAAVDAGGAFGLLVRDHAEPPELGSVRRFDHAWERDASLRLRRGDPDVLNTYARHGRIVGGDREQMLATAHAAWAADEAANRISLLLAADRDTVTDLNQAARAHRVTTGQVEPGGVLLRDGTHAGVGDRIITRRNNRRLATARGWVKNGDTFTVTARNRDGSLTVRRPGGGPTLRLPADYVAAHVQLGYAATVHRAQGATVDTAHVLVTATTRRTAFYVAMTRARQASIAYACPDTTGLAHDHLGHRRATALAILRAVLANTAAPASAHETLHAEHDRAGSIATLAAEYQTLATTWHASQWATRLRTAGVPAEHVQRLAAAPGWPALVAELRATAPLRPALHPDLARLADDAIRAAEADPALAVHRALRHANRRPRRRPDRLIAGLIPAAGDDITDPQTRRALDEREHLITVRAEALARLAVAEHQPWTAQLGTRPTAPAARRAWDRAVVTIAAYRDRHHITGHHVLGRVDEVDPGARADYQRAARALRTARRNADQPVPRRRQAEHARTEQTRSRAGLGAR